MDADVAVADQIRARERARLRALVVGDLEAAREFHADDFRLITPRGDSWSKGEYLGALATGALKYLVWEPGTIDVRVYGGGSHSLPVSDRSPGQRPEAAAWPDLAHRPVRTTSGALAGRLVPGDRRTVIPTCWPAIVTAMLPKYGC